MADDLQTENPPEPAPSDCNGSPHLYAHEKGPHSPVYVGRCMSCGVIDWAGLREDVAAKVAEAVASRDEELERLRLAIGVNYGLYRSAQEDADLAEAAIARVRGWAEKHVVHVDEKAGMGVYIAATVLRLLDGPAVSEEQAGNAEEEA